MGRDEQDVIKRQGLFDELQIMDSDKKRIIRECNSAIKQNRLRGRNTAILLSSKNGVKLGEVLLLSL